MRHEDVKAQHDPHVTTGVKMLHTQQNTSSKTHPNGCNC